LQLDDTNELSSILCDPETMKYYPKYFNMEQTVDWPKRNILNYKKYRYGLWAVILKNSNIFLGDCGITMQVIDGEFLPELGNHIKKNN
jgi:RimJ/RimL family protein N-acetyltransferase